jgi:hypothetical protein
MGAEGQRRERERGSQEGRLRLLLLWEALLSPLLEQPRAGPPRAAGDPTAGAFTDEASGRLIVARIWHALQSSGLGQLPESLSQDKARQPLHDLHKPKSLQRERERERERERAQREKIARADYEP